MYGLSVTTTSRTLLVGSGKIAAHLAPLILKRGEVFALRRSDAEPPSGVTGIRADLAAPLASRLPAVDAMVVTLPPGEGVSAYRTALTHLAEALPAIPARTVFVSSTGVFDGPGAARADHRAGRSGTDERALARTARRRAGGRRDLRCGRREAGRIYGPGRDFLLRKVREGAAVEHARRTNRIHETDLVRTLELLLRTPAPPRLVHAVDESPAPLGEVVGFIARELGVDVPPDIGSADPGGFVYDGSLLRSLLGTLEYPTYREGYAEMIAGPTAS